MRLRVETVVVRMGDTVGIAVGRSDSDPGIAFVFGGDARMMVDLGNAMVEADGSIEVDVPEWAILDRIERPE